MFMIMTAKPDLGAIPSNGHWQEITELNPNTILEKHGGFRELTSKNRI